MKRNLLSVMMFTALAVGGALQAEPTPSSDRASKTDARRSERPKQALAEGWTYVKGEWIHADGYKYVKGQVIRAGGTPQKRAPKPPSQALLNSVKTKPAPTPDPNSAAAKAAEKERNLQPRPASQTGTHL